MSSDKQSNHNEFAWLDAAKKRLRQGEAAALIEEALEALAHDEQNAQLLQIASLAYAYQGQGQQAEPYARRALTLISEDRVSSSLHIEMAHVCLYDSLIAQGRFAEASQSLGSVVSQVPHTNAILLLIAWGYFLAGSPENARHALMQQTPIDQSTFRDEEVTNMFPSYLLMDWYMRYVLGINPRGSQPYPVPQALRFFYAGLVQSMKQTLMDQMMQAVPGFLARWEDEAQRHAHNPYGKRLGEILEEVRLPEWQAEYLDRVFPTGL